MSRRNLLALLIVTLVAGLCYQRVQQNFYGRVLANAMSRIENGYLEPVAASQLFEGAMDGMLGKLDDYSAYISPGEMEEFREELDQEFGGVGVEVALDPQSKQLTVVCPLPGSPAFKAGIRAGDKILRIRDTSTQGMSLNDAANLLRGKPGQSVAVTVEHLGEKTPVELTIVREMIQGDTVRGDTRNADGSWNYFLADHKRIGYLRISSFTDNTPDELERALKWLVNHKMRGLVLDLRDDPGGYLAAAIDVCDMLIPSGVIVTTRRRDGRVSETYDASGEAEFTDFPMAVLIDRNSASAAEIVAACLQDHHRAVIVGQRSFGKGTVQEIIDLESGCGAMKLTTASYWRPSGKNIAKPRNAGPKDSWGVSPDDGFEVVVNDEELGRWEQWRGQRDTDLSSVNGSAAKESGEPFTDRPLQRAVEYLEKEK